MNHQAENLKNQLIRLVKGNDLENYRAIVGDLLDEYDASDVAAAALKYAVEGASVEEKEPEAINFENTGAAAGMVRFFMNIGRVQQISPQEISQWIAKESGIPGKSHWND